ncbi:hypothetical protein M2368_000613 [Arthrobacter sp. JUb119]|nr:hypothetical protein [Arthrobacter sp. JUb119]PRB78402.1 hypothetical protein CQ012_03180 [Arthrobacter sp. MYb214]
MGIQLLAASRWEEKMTDGNSPAAGSEDSVQKHRLESSAEDQLEHFTGERRRAARPMEKTVQSPPETDDPDAGEEQGQK